MKFGFASGHLTWDKMLQFSCEGMVGVSLLMGGDSTPNRAVVIRNARGRIVVLDRRGLERRTCECCRVVKNEYDRLLPQLMSA